MKKLLFGLSIWLGVLLPTSAAAAGENGIRLNHGEPIEHLSMQMSSPTHATDNAAATLRFQAMGREFVFRLQPNRSLLRAVGNSVDAERVEIYKGSISGAAHSWARFIIADELPQGVFFDGTTLYAVEAAVDASGGSEPIVFRLEDLIIPPGMLQCGHVSHSQNASQLFHAVEGEAERASASAPGAVSAMDIGLVADYEFTNDKGSGTALEMIARMNIVDGIFSSQLGVQLNVTLTDSFPSSNDPFSDTTNPGLLIDEVVAFRVQSNEQKAAGLTHLFTGRDLDGSNVGIAYGNTLCHDRLGVGLTQGTHSTTMDALIAAHEIGHNFGAPHDGTSGSPCETTSTDYLMAPSINGSDEFSACSITEMQDDIANAACITPLPSTDIAVVAGSVPSDVFTDDNVNVTFDVDSIGTEDANNVTLDVTLPPNVTVNGVSATSGSCSTGAGTASCTLGTIAGGSGVTVTLDTTATAAGNASFTALGGADSDANANNNDATAAYSVTSAVDLAVLPAAAAQVALNAAITIRPVLENRSSLSATNVTLTITPDAGLRIDSISSPGGSCGIDAGGIASCQLATMSGQGSEPVDVRVTGIAEGSRSYTITATADETDRDLSNNDRAGQVTVGNPPPPPAPSEESGGGSFGWLSLLLLTLTRAFLRPRMRA